MNALPKIRNKPISEVSPMCLVIRVFAERKNNQWQAFTLELGLAVQADTLPEVKHKLESMILSYVTDALTGEDREHAYELLNRRATWRVYLNYYVLSVFYNITSFLDHSKDRIFYKEPMPLEPKACTV